MRLTREQKLNDLIKKHPDCEKQIASWIERIEGDEYENPHQLKQSHQKASIIGDKNVVFNICGNKYRIWTKVNYHERVVLVIKVGTHEEYNNWDINKKV